MKKIILLFGFALFLFNDIAAQQYPMFTNFLMNRWGYNPAIGANNGCIHANLVYHKQWVGLSQAPETGAIGLRYGFGNLSLGASILQDKAGILEYNAISPQASYRIHYGPKGYVSLGASVGFSNLTISNDVEASDVLDPLAMIGGKVRQRPDMNVGFAFRYDNFELAASSPFFLNRRIMVNDTATAGDYLHHYFMSAVYTWDVTSKVSLEPAAFCRIVEQGPPQFEVGGRAYLDKIWLGGMLRIGDAFSVGMGLRFPNFDMGYSYDITTSSLRKASSGSHEIGVEYRICRKKKKKEDKDGDGIPDKEDPCPDYIGTADSPCPVDTDKDGLYDHEDDCPLAYGPIENVGCPEKPADPEPPKPEGPDADGDGCLDADDLCPNSKGTGEDCCPKPTVAELNILEYAIRNLYFDTDKATIRKEAFWHMDRLAKLLIEKKGWKVRVTGHTDSRATDDYNLKLSARRAKAAHDYLVGKGVPELLLLIGYEGEEKPAADNVTEVGMQKNRRVELEFVFD